MNSHLLCRVIAIMLAASLLGACVPMRFPVFDVSGEGQKQAGYCIAGIKNVLLAEAPHGVHINWWAENRGPEGSLWLRIYLEIPEGVSVRFESERLQLESPGWTEPKGLSIKAITAPGPLQFAADALLVGPVDPARQRHLLWFLPDSRGNAYRTDIPFVSEFSVRLPPMSINGEPWQAGPVSFTAARRWGMYTCIQ
ncbi:MAG: hypothetical protein H3C57_06205 [Gammaproteobacteria bacterium]|nr:hypothetical protein [Gammaproteobacteria bacterium]